jgi:molecular chaperone GrpE
LNEFSKKSVGPKKGKFYLKKIDDLRNQLLEERQKAEKYFSQLQYLQADFDNYEKRVNREREDQVKLSAERIIMPMLSIIDDIEKAIVECKKTTNSDSVLKGLEMILSNFIGILRREGLDEIKASGQPFNPNFHEVVSTIETNKAKENTIIQVIRKGYLLRGKVIRVCMVEIATKSVKKE